MVESMQISQIFWYDNSTFICVSKQIKTKKTLELSYLFKLKMKCANTRGKKNEIRKKTWTNRKNGKKNREMQKSTHLFRAIKIDTGNPEHAVRLLEWTYIRCSCFVYQIVWQHGGSLTQAQWNQCNVIFFDGATHIFQFAINKNATTLLNWLSCSDLIPILYLRFIFIFFFAFLLFKYA